MHSSNSRPSFASYALKNLGLAALYLAMAELGLQLNSPDGSLTMLWPAAGLGLAAVLIWGWRLAPAVAVGSFLTAFFNHDPWQFCFWNAVGNTASTLAGLWLLRWRGLDNTLERVRDVVELVAWGGAAASVISATVGALALAATGISVFEATWHSWLTWWLGHSMGVILVAPVLLTWIARSAGTWRQPRFGEAALWLVIYVLVGMLVFGGRITPGLADALDFLPFPLLLWAALRFGRRLTSTASLLLSYGAVVAASLGSGPFADQPPQEALFIMWAYLGSLSVGALCLAAALGQSQRALKALSGHRDDLTEAVSRRTSELVKAANALAASEERYRTLVEESPLGVALIAEDGRYLYLNSAFTRMLGYSLPELASGDKWFRRAFPDPELRQRVIRTWQQDKTQAEPGQVRPRTYPVRCKDGAEKEILFRPVTLSGGEQLVIYEDVSRRERASRALAESDARQRALLDSLHEGVALLDQDGVILSWNQAAAQITGAAARDTLGRNCLEIAWPLFLLDGTPCPEERLPSHLVMRSGQPLNDQLYIYRAGDRERWLSVNARPLFQDDSGRIAMVSISFADVTERKQAAQALAESEEKFSKVFQHSPVWVVLASLDEGRYLDVNQAFLEQTGWQREEVIGHTAQELGIRPDAEEREWVINNILEQGAVYDLELKRRTKDGRELDVLYSGTIIEIGGVKSLLSLVQNITERKRAEEALKASEDKFSRLYMTSPVWMALGSLTDYRYLEVNRAFEQITGYTRQEAVGRTPVELGLWPNPEHRQALMEKVKQDGKLHQEPIALRMRSGETRHFLWSAETLQLGQETALISVLLDVTELDRAKQALAESENSFRTVVENSLAGIYVVQDGRWSYVNPRLAQMLGYDSPRELVGKIPWDLVHPEDREMVQGLGGARELHHVETNRYTFRALTRDGRVVWLETLGTHATYRGRPANVGNVIDITQRMAAEQALKESEEQYRLLVDTAQDAIYIIQDGKLVFANPMVERITGRTAEELADTSFTELLHPEDRELAVKRYQERVAGKPVPDNYPMRVIGADGRARWIQASAVSLSWKGRPAILYVARDISEQRRMENQLRQSQKLEAVGTLAGGIAHDFNNILAAIMGYAELSLGEAPPEGRVHVNLEHIITACLRARDLVRQILSFSRHGKRRLQPLLLGSSVEEVMRLIRATIPSNIEIKADLEEGGRVMADPVQIHQLLMNLCANAAQAMEPQGGVIWVTLKRARLGPRDEAVGPTLPPGPYLRLSVADNGPGMSSEVKERIFEPFFTTKEPGRGSGLGLSAVHGILQGHHGAISLEDRPGGGTVFHVLLPEVDEEQAEPEPPAEPPRSRHGERVIFVDDEPALVEVGRHILERLGYRVEAFTDSPKALDAFRADPGAYDLVITDQTMPLLTGATLAREVKAIRPELPVIIATGFSHQLDPAQAREIGVAAFVMKPISTYEIAQVARQALDQAQGLAPEENPGSEA